MRPPIGFTIGLMHHLLSLSSTYLELRSAREEFLPTPIHRIVVPDKCFANMSYCEIPVKVPNTETQIMTCVSPSDYEDLKSMASTWRMNNNGYVVTSRRKDGKYQLLYMHKIVAGGPAKHLNGDRLDNRRENLIPTKPRRPFIQLTPLDINSTHPLMDYVQDVEQAMINESIGKYSTITYSHGKTYSGETHNGLPHGLGTLIEQNRSSFGWFIYGQFKSGCVLDHPPVCDRLQYLYTSPYRKPIRDAFVVLPSGRHQRFR